MRRDMLSVADFWWGGRSCWAVTWPWADENWRQRYLRCPSSSPAPDPPPPRHPTHAAAPATTAARETLPRPWRSYAAGAASTGTSMVDPISTDKTAKTK